MKTLLTNKVALTLYRQNAEPDFPLLPERGRVGRGFRQNILLIDFLRESAQKQAQIGGKCDSI